MDDIGVFTPEQARELWQDYQRRKQLQPHIQSNYPVRRPVDDPSPHRVFVRNDSYEDVPAYACMKITGTAEVGGRTTLTIDKPDSTDGEFVFNSQFSIASGGTGWAYRFGVVVMLGVAPTETGAQYRPVADMWHIEEGAGPFVVFGEHNAKPNGLIGRFTGVSGGGLTIRFRIVASYFCGSCYVEARVISVPFGVSVSSLPDVDTYDNNAVRIYDRTGCKFNEPPEDLVNRIGYATYMTPLEDGPCPDTIFSSWECIDLCCAEETCD
jgi:hypothetical protein